MIMLSKMTTSSPTRDAATQQESRHRGHTSDTWPPHVFDAVVDILAEILVAEYQSTHSIGSSPRLTSSDIRRHPSVSQEGEGA
jgi:hypothetical protein